jgi:hypothetical protein
VWGDAGLIGEVHQCRGAADHHVVDAAAAVGLFHRDGVDPVREVLGRALLEHLSGVDAVREPFESERPAVEIPDHSWCDRLVVADEVALGQAVAGEEHLAGLAQFDGPAADPDLVGAHCARSLTTWRGDLSVRSPWNLG